MSAERPRYLCLAGPTAAGKTAAALAIAAALPVEIISVDSALVYRGMDIGTAKPSAKELAAVPHHLIDILEPTQTYSAARFVQDANRLINEIQARGKLPLLVGGTMLYFKALFDGLDPMPQADPVVRAAIEAQAKALGWPAMHTQLKGVDPVTAGRLEPTDAQRIGRALEVFRISGQPLSDFHTIKSRAEDKGTTRAYALISLEPTERGWLHERIALRFEAMLQAGFLDEVRRLRSRGDLSPETPAMRCVGYRQAWAYLDAQTTDSGGSSSDVQALLQFKAQGIAATRQLAKRQITWLRGMPQRRVVACDAPDALQQVLQLTTTLLQGAT